MNRNAGKRIFFDAIVFGYLLVTAIIVCSHAAEPESLVYLRAGLFVLCCVAGGTVAMILRARGIQTLGGALFERPQISDNTAPRTWYKTFWGGSLIFLFLVTFVIGWVVTDMNLYELVDEHALNGAGRLFAALASPQFDILPTTILAAIETVFIAFMATVIAVPVAFFLSFLSAKNIMGGSAPSFVCYGVLRTVLNIIRSVEALIWAIIASVWVGIGPFAGMLALMIHSVAALAKQYSELVECVDEGPIEAIQATGATAVQTVRFAVIPQIVLPYISFTIYRWDINVRMATIIGLVGGGGIGEILIQYQGQAMWHEVGCIIVVIAVIVWVMDTASAYIREAIK